MRIKKNKEQKSIKLENKHYEELGCELSLCKETRVKPFCGENVVNRSIKHVDVKFGWKAQIALKKYWSNAGVSFSKEIGDDAFHLKHKVLSFISKSWVVEWFNVSISKLKLMRSEMTKNNWETGEKK